MESISDKIHFFKEDISGIELPIKFTFPFCYEPHILCRYAANEVYEYIKENIPLFPDVSEGKMFGVLIVLDDTGTPGFLAAYSGLLNNKNQHKYFVPPIYNLLNPGGYFKKEESVISGLSLNIDKLEHSMEHEELKLSLSRTEKDGITRISEFKILMKEKKRLRDEMRDVVDKEKLIKESQFYKAELKRIQSNINEDIMHKKLELEQFQNIIEDLKRERKQRSADLQKRLFDSYIVLNALGEKSTLTEIFIKTVLKFPPGGSGECCAPKLLQFAYANGLKPVAMAEFWIGKSPVSIIRKEMEFYPSCSGKCGPILGYMLQGLDVEDNPLEQSVSLQTIEKVFEDDYIIIVNKPQAILSVPGKIKSESVEDILKSEFGRSDLKAVHRLDMATSGLLMFAKGEVNYKMFQQLFSSHSIEKHYIALLDGHISVESGVIKLPLSSDYIERPKQKVDYEHGKESITYFKVIEHLNNITRIDFNPITGRTHQLRMHSAHKDGLNVPIKGDELYGKKDKRLYLHSFSMRFIHPFTGQKIYVSKNPEF